MKVRLSASYLTTDRSQVFRAPAQINANALRYAARMGQQLSDGRCLAELRFVEKSCVFW